MKIFSEDGQCFIDMEYALTINEVSQFHQEITPLLTTDKEFVVHCIDLKDIDSTGLQILIALKKQLNKANILFEITAGYRFKEYIDFFQLTQYFEGDIV